jgi:hypothetical protein
MRRPFVTLIAGMALSGAISCNSPRPPTGPTPVDPLPPRGGTATVAAAGDIGLCGSPGVARTARLVEAIPGQVLLAGDIAYPNGAPQDFIACFDPDWGQFRNRWRPVPGNHDYNTPGAAGYFQYFGEAAGRGGRSFYSFITGDWLVLMIDSNIAVERGSEQFEFVRTESQRYAGLCTMVVAHHPRFSSGPNGDNRFMRDLWTLLYEQNADVVVSGHDHLYERFGKQDADGRSDVRGLRQFIVGTGGADLYDFFRVTPNSQVRVKSYGVVRFTLNPGNYDWTFLDDSGLVRDSGADSCH